MLNGKLENAIPFQAIKWISICLIVCLVILMFSRSRVHHNKGIHYKATKIAGILNITLSAWTMYFILFYSTEINRAYYIISICLIMSTLFQNAIYHCFLSISKKVN